MIRRQKLKEACLKFGVWCKYRVSKHAYHGGANELEVSVQGPNVQGKSNQVHIFLGWRKCVRLKNHNFSQFFKSL
jgi:hypothetical protein